MNYVKEITALTITSISLACLQTSAAAFTLAKGTNWNKDSKQLSELSFLNANLDSSVTSLSDLLPDSSSMTTDGYIAIDAVATSSSSDLYGSLVDMGLLHGSQYERIVSGLLPVAVLPELESLEHLKFYQQPQYITNVGAVTSQADISIRSDVARETFGVSGKGVTIGALSDGFNALGGATADIASGDLPGSGNPLGNVTPVNVLQDLPPGSGIDEGRAMLQLIHDIAPSADLAFHTAFLGQANFANGILDLANVAGADVIVDDITYFAAPMFQDGIVAQAVDRVVSDGVAYFSSAGNTGRNAYESSFVGSEIVDDVFGEFHDFDPGSGVDILQSITVPEGTEFTMSFQWDSPFFSVSGKGSPNDLNIFLLDETETTLLAGSVSNNLERDPLEVFRFVNDGSFGSDLFNLVITQTAGPVANLMKYVMFDFEGEINEFDTESGTLYGHANAEGAEAVGAALYAQTPEFGTTPPVIRSFSASGPTPILFDTEGNRLTSPEIRQKPEIVAPDGTNTTFFFRDTLVDVDEFPNFPGTSAAAPHAAAVAALMLEAAPGTRPEDIYALLEETAIDMDDPLTPGFDAGFDFASGQGLIQAERAIAAAIEAQEVPEPSGVIALFAVGMISLGSRLKRKP